jgi:hypothetical protein
MSFSFTARAADKAAIAALIAGQMDIVVNAQPSHAVDKPLVLATAQAYLDLLIVDESKDLMANVSGSLSWRDVDHKEFTGANIGVSVYMIAKDLK